MGRTILSPCSCLPLASSWGDFVIGRFVRLPLENWPGECARTFDKRTRSPQINHRSRHKLHCNATYFNFELESFLFLMTQNYVIAYYLSSPIPPMSLLFWLSSSKSSLDHLSLPSFPSIADALSPLISILPSSFTSITFSIYNSSCKYTLDFFSL